MTSALPDPAPPFRGFFLRVEALAAGAFRTIPCVGDGIADFFLDTVVPYCAPRRDRVLLAAVRRVRALEGGLQLILMRALPLPGPSPSQCFFGVTARNGYGVPLPSPNGSASFTQK